MERQGRHVAASFGYSGCSSLRAFPQLLVGSSRLNRRFYEVSSAFAKRPSDPKLQACQFWAHTKLNLGCYWLKKNSTFTQNFRVMTSQSDAVQQRW